MLSKDTQDENYAPFFSKCVNCSGFILGASFHDCTAPINSVCTAATKMKVNLS